MKNAKKKRTALETKEARNAYFFLLPNLTGFILFTAFPIIAGMALSFTNFTGFNKPDFVGLKNYARLLTDQNVSISLKNNFFYSFTMVPLTIFFALVIALMIQFGIRKLKEFYKMIVFLPNITSAIAIAVIWKQLFAPGNGPINRILSTIGVANPPQWLTSSKWAMTAVVIVAVWHSIGINTILLLSGLQGIPAELYDAAAVDGASGIKRITKVTIPLLTPVLFFTIIMTTINSFKVFELVFQMTDGGPGRATNVLVYRIYKEAFASLNYGYASAEAYILFVIILILTIIQFVVQKYWVYDGG